MTRAEFLIVLVHAALSLASLAIIVRNLVISNRLLAQVEALIIKTH